MDKQVTRSRLWTVLAALAAVMWGISGLFAESLFKISSKITPIWLTQVRLIISGIVLLIIATILHQKPILVLKKQEKYVAHYCLWCIWFITSTGFLLYCH